MFEKLRQLFTRKHDVEPLKEVTEPQKPKLILNDFSVFKTPEGQGRWCLVIGKEGQGKTFLVRELAKRYKTFAYMEASEFQPTTNTELLIIDDLHKASKEKLNELALWLCNARHDEIKKVICVAQELKPIPSELMRRFTVFAFFYSAKQTMKLQTVIKGTLKDAMAMSDAIIRLQPREYFLYDVQTGFFKNPPLSNTNTDLLIQALEHPLKGPTKPLTVETKIKLENGEKVTRKDVKITPLIIQMLKEHPEYKYRFIAEQHHTTVDYVKKVASRWQRGLTKYN